jgi:hypothetical protein
MKKTDPVADSSVGPTTMGTDKTILSHHEKKDGWLDKKFCFSSTNSLNDDDPVTLIGNEEIFPSTVQELVNVALTSWVLQPMIGYNVIRMDFNNHERHTY